VRLAELAESAGHYEDAEALCELALNWYEGDDNPAQAIKLKRMRTLVRMQRGQTARETLNALVALVDEATLAGADAERASILLVASQMLGRLGDQREAQRVAEECVAIAEGVGDPVLLCDSYNRLGLCLVLSEPERARELFRDALELIVPLSDVFRRVRLLNNIGFLELTANRFVPARESLRAAVTFARTGKLVDLWARACLNLGVIAFRSGDYEDASQSLGEALRLSAEAQQTELQIIVAYNLGHLAREQGDLKRAGETYELAMELAERVGQSDIKAGALAGMAVCRLALGEVEEASRMSEQLKPLIEGLPGWFQGRELVEGLSIYLALRRTWDEAYQLFTRALALAESRDLWGAGWLLAEFGLVMKSRAPEAIAQVARRFQDRRELLEMPKIRERFGVLLLDSA